MSQPFQIPLPIASVPPEVWSFPEAENAFDIGIRALRAGFLEPARAIFQALASRESMRPAILVEWARTEFVAGNFSETERLLGQLDGPASHRPAAQILRADLALGRRNAALGLSLGFRICESFPTDPWSRFFMARLSWMGGEEESAELGFLSLAGEAEVGSRACAWAVLCGWRQGQFSDEIAALHENLRRDDVVCEGLRSFGARELGLDWTPNPLVEPGLRDRCAREWAAMFQREFGTLETKTALVRGPHLG